MRIFFYIVVRILEDIDTSIRVIASSELYYYRIFIFVI